MWTVVLNFLGTIASAFGKRKNGGNGTSVNKDLVELVETTVNLLAQAQAPAHDQILAGIDDIKAEQVVIKKAQGTMGRNLTKISKRVKALEGD